MLSKSDLVALIEPSRLVAPPPWVGHIPFAAWLVRLMAPQVVVELGTHTGNSYCTFCQTIAESGLATKAYAVDTWQGDVQAGQYDESVYEELSQFHDPRYGQFSTLMRMTFDAARSAFADASIDLLHIDGLHTYDAVRHDFENWLPKMSARGVVLLHDTCVVRDDFGVHRLWAELRQQYPSISFPHCNGLGVLLVGKDQPSELMALTDRGRDAELREGAIRLFSLLGGRFETKFEMTAHKEHIAKLEEAIAEQSVNASALYTAISDRETQIYRLSEDLKGQSDTLKEKNADLVRTQLQIEQLLSSRSWRMTSGLRAIAHWVHEWARKPTVRFVRNGYAVAIAQVRQHGLRGFFRRIPYYIRNFRGKIGVIAGSPMLSAVNQFGNVPPDPRSIRLHPDLDGEIESIENKVSVIIPTLNAGDEFVLLLRKLRSQQAIQSIEIVIVDSGSTDGTVAVARSMGCVVVEIPPTDFSHSYARNQGADAASGDYFLFMVQDAYPIGDYWIYGMLCYLLDHAGEKLVAASCAEYCRSDSDLMYDSMVHTHYQFLGCQNYDRIGSFSGDDHMALRSQGQLSDVSCLISREVFSRYRYRGDYAEDLDLGIRLIRDGYRVAMLASVKVIHSHNRPAYYYLKRSFVDVIFLVGIFDDFQFPEVDSSTGLLRGIFSVASYLGEWLAARGAPDSVQTVGEDLAHLIDDWRGRFKEVRSEIALPTGDARLDAYLASLRSRFALPLGEQNDKAVRAESQRFLDAFLARLDHFKSFVSQVYGPLDAALQEEISAAVLKTFAATVGSSLAFMYLSEVRREGLPSDMTKRIFDELKAGV